MCWWPLEVSWAQVEKRRGHRDGDSSDLCLLRWRSQDVGWGVRYLGWVRVFI